MNDLPEQQSLPDIGATVGAMLGAARRSANMSVSEVATQLRRGINQIEALEADDYQRLLGATFVRGLIRNYAKLVNIDADPVIKAYEAAVPREAVPKIGLETSHIRFQGAGHGIGIPQIKAPSPGVIGMVAAGLLAAGALWFFSGDRMAKPAESGANPAAEQSAGSPVTPPAAIVRSDQLTQLPSPGTNAAPAQVDKTPAEKAAEARAVAERLTQEKIAADKVAAERAQEEKRAAEKAAAEEKRAAEKAAAEKIAAEKEAEKTARIAATQKAAAEKASAEKAAADQAAQKATQKAEEKASAEKAAAEKAKLAEKAAEEAKAKRITAKAVMKFNREAWVEVTDVRGRIIYSELNPAGSTKEISGAPPLRFTVGNAEHVSITFNGKPVDMAPHIGREVARFTLQ
ncbi:MAG: RodZ domain-containing protein [Burkholderiales bacterium]